MFFFNSFNFTPTWGDDLIDKYFSDGLKLPTRQEMFSQFWNLISQPPALEAPDDQAR